MHQGRLVFAQLVDFLPLHEFSKMPPPLSGRLSRPDILLPRPTPVHDVRATDVPRQLARHRNLSPGPATKALPCRHSGPRLSQHLGRRQRAQRARSRATPLQKAQKVQEAFPRECKEFSMSMRCDRCRFFHAYPPAHESDRFTSTGDRVLRSGECRYSPPVQCGHDWLARFPLVTEDYWCGRFETDGNH